MPEQVGIMGFDDTFMGQFLNPRLSTVRQPTAQMAREAVTFLLDCIENPGDHPPLLRSFPAELICEKVPEPVYPEQTAGRVFFARL